MKNKKIILIIILIIIIFGGLIAFLIFKPFEKNSNNTTKKDHFVSIKCDNVDINVGKTTSCTLKGYSKSDIRLFEGSLTSSDNIEISNIVKSNIWKIGDNDSNIQLISDGASGDFEILTFDVKGLKNGTGKIMIKKLNDKLQFTSKDIIEYKIDEIEYEINVK